MSPAVPVLDLRGERTRPGTLLRDLWAHRDLVLMLARQDYHSRYRSASLGLLWALALPLLQGVVIAVVFGKLVGGGSASTYVPYVLTGVTAYAFVSASLAAAGTAIVDNAAIAGRIYFPRLVLPAVAPTANLVGLALATAFTAVLSLALGADPGWWLLLAPASGCLSWLLVVSGGALLSMLHVYSRDVKYILQASLLVLFYATPIIYFLEGSEGIRPLPESLRPYVVANPVTGVLQLNRLALTGEAAYVVPAVIVTGCWVLAFVVLSVVAYSRHERVACDRL